ncbi:response regulator [Endozoicomonas montiporae]|nr:response regulator [Endozoicomonas montiporae]
MKQSDSQLSQTKFRHGLAATLFGWFMILSLTPIAIIGFNEYREGKKNIVDSRYQELTTINLLLSQQVNDYFDSVVTNLFIKAGTAQDFLHQLKTGFVASNNSLNDFVYSDPYNRILDEYSREFLDFLRFYDYSDVILADSEGNILYTVNAYSDLGKNLFNDEALKETSFFYAVKNSIEQAEPRYADVDLYPAVQDQPVSFFILPLVNDREEVVGVLAVQILAYNVQSIFENDNQFGEGLKSYLVGTDQYVRYGTELGSDQTMKIKVNNPLVENWIAHLDDDTFEFVELDEHLDHDHGHDELSESEFDDLSLDMEDEGEHSKKNEVQVASVAHILSYKNADSMSVLGTFHPINVAGTPLVMISEVLETDAFASVKSFRNRLLFIAAITILLVLMIALLITRRLVKPIRTITAWVNRVASGDYVQVDVISGHNEISELSSSFAEMTEKLRQVINDNKRKSWQQDGQAGLNDSIRGDHEIAELCKNIVSYLAKYLGMQTGAMYVLDDEKQLQLMGSYAWSRRKQTKNSFEFGEGMVGQAALEQQTIELTNLPEDYMTVESGLGMTPPQSVIVVPLIYENEVKGVLEFGLLKPLNEEQKAFLERSVENVAIGINSAQYRTRVNQLLDKTTKQSEAMREQQEELKAVNDELENRAKILEESQEELQAQSEEMQKSNVELEEKTEMLQQQKAEIERKNLDIELSSKSLEEKAKELELASKYKSEFLANMSHELRTPLNSLLLLAQMLADNDEGNLTEDQIESAEVIYNGGKELLDLINDILDLSKVEAGKMAINLEDVDIEELCTSAKTLFKPLADDRGLDFSVEVDPGTTQVILSDSQRLMQIIKNFLSNGFKFTEKGGVYIRIHNTSRQTEHGEETYVAFDVRDTGIGIPEEKQKLIFEAFQQADGSTSRQYGGTGLGLAISREMANMLGGYIGIESTEGEGTTFTLYLPDNAVCSLTGERVLADSYSPSVSEGLSGNSTKKADAKSEKSRKKIKEMDSAPPVAAAPSVPRAAAGKTLLLIEDDEHFSGILAQIGERHHFVCLIAHSGQEGIEMAKSSQPGAIVLDLGLPDMDGEAVLNKLKSDPATKDIPVHIISGRVLDDVRNNHAVGYLTKPVTVADLESVFTTLEQAISADISHTLLLDADDNSRVHMKELLVKKGLNVGEAATAADAMSSQLEHNWQCLVMDVDLPDMSGLSFLEGLNEKLQGKMPSIVIYTSRSLEREEHNQLQKYSSSMVMKGDLASDRVLDEVSLFMHSIDKNNDAEEEPAAIAEHSLEGHKILLVDDDLRNTFALSKGLQALGLEVLIADNGQNALIKLEEEDGIELVLMDIMMPVMDGYEAMTKMRENPHLKDLPVIALTAKAMSDDKAKCIDAGANDYMTKPVDIEKLVAMMKLWLFK